MSGSVHPNPDLIFHCLVFTGNVTWRSRSVQCCTCFKWAYLRCSLFCSLLELSSLLLLEVSHLTTALCLPIQVPPACISPLISLVPLCQCSALAPPSPSNLLPFFCPRYLCFLCTPLCFWLFSYTSSFFFPMNRSEFFSGILEVMKPEELNYHTLSRLLL